MTKESDLDEWVENIKEQIIQEDLKLFSKKVVDLFYNPQNLAPIDEWKDLPTEKSSCGHSIKFILKINKKGIIKDAKFFSDGCGATIASASMTTILIKGKSVAEAMNLTAEQIDQALDGLPADHKHCSVLAARSLKEALNRYKLQ